MGLAAGHGDVSFSPPLQQLFGPSVFSHRSLHLTGHTMDQQDKPSQQMTLETAATQLRTVRANVGTAHVASGSDEKWRRLCSLISKLYLGARIRKLSKDCLAPILQNLCHTKDGYFLREVRMRLPIKLKGCVLTIALPSDGGVCVNLAQETLWKPRLHPHLKEMLFIRQCLKNGCVRRSSTKSFKYF